jgi:predicted Zn-dependent protease
MVLPTPFERLLQETVQLANRDPNAAFTKLDELYGKSQTEQDILQLGSIAVHLGATSLGRWAETSAFQQRLLQHPALIADSTVARSLWRGLAVVERGAGRSDEAEKAIQKGVHGPADECRLAIMSAQTLAVRGRAQEAISYLRQTAALCHELPEKDEVIAQIATVAGNLLRVSEPQVRLAQELLIAAATASSAAIQRAGDWRAAHRALFQEGLSYCLAAKPTHAHDGNGRQK